MCTSKQGQQRNGIQRQTWSQKRQKANADTTDRIEADNIDNNPAEILSDLELEGSKQDEVMTNFSEEDTVVGGSGGRVPMVSTTLCMLKLNVVGGKTLMEELWAC